MTHIGWKANLNKREIIYVNRDAIVGNDKSNIAKLDMYYKDILKKEFGISYYNDDEVEELFEIISKYKNIPVNGEVNYERVSTLIVNTIKQEKIKNITFDRLWK